MSKVNRRAGQNVRELAIKRRVRAIVSFASAGSILFFPTLLMKSFETLLKKTAFQTPSQSLPTLNLSPALYLLFGLAALGLITDGVLWWKRAARADQGAQGEEDIAKELVPLEQTGWKIEYGIYLKNGLGDADIFCISPKNNAYVIDVKSHKGVVVSDGKQLCRRRGQTSYPFEKNFLEQVTKQALQIKGQKKLRFVTPILAFSKAKVTIPKGKLQNVYIVEKSRLSSLLRSLG